MTTIQTLNPKREEEKRIFKPLNEKQREFMYSQKPELLLGGAVGAGKSYMGCWKGLMLNLKYPGNRGFICRKENTSLPGSTLFTLFNQVLPREWIISHNKIEGKIVHATPIKGVYSTIVYGGLDKPASKDYPTKIGSTQFGWVFADETIELTKGDWDMLATRLRYQIPRYTKNQNDRIPRQIFGATNPDAPHHWLYKKFFQCTKEEKEQRDSWLVTPYENPYLPKDYIKHLEITLAGVNKDRLLLGKWVSAEGIIYKSFDVTKHVVDESGLLQEIKQDGSRSFNIRLYKNVIFAADANFPLPRACLLIGIRGDGSVDIIDEFYEENAHIEKLGKWIQDWAEKLGRGVQGYHDPSSPDDIDALNKMKNIICDKAKNAVSPGISEVTRYFENNLIRINVTCIALIRQLQSYVWKKNSNPQIPLKQEDHTCFVKGTKILTLNGEISIEKIKPNDYVLTRKGWKRVDVSKITDYKSEVYEVLLSNRKKIICTGNHPIWIKGKGFKRVDSLRYSYIIVDSLRYLWKTKYLMEGAIIKGKMDIGEGEEDSIICTEMFGNITMGRFLKDIISITKMVIKITMNYQTLNVYPQKSTLKNIQKQKNKLIKIKNFLKRLDHLLKSGIEVKKEKNGTHNMAKKLGRIEKKQLEDAINVIKNIVHHFQQDLNFVIPTANKKLYVLDVKKLEKKQKVYNLSVEDCHEYFAEGILVSNCDALRYGLNSIKQIRVPSKFRAIY